MESIASRGKADDLLSLRLGLLKHLALLEFPTVANDDEALDHIEEIRNLSEDGSNNGAAYNLRRDANFRHLDASLERCPNVANLHVRLDDIKKVKTIRFLCLQSDVIVINVAERIVRWLATSLSQVETIHAHYRDFENVEHDVTWVLLGSSHEELQGQVAPASEQPQPQPMNRGPAIHGKPCFCSTQTFIGLAKPQNRGRKTNL
ncbi:hypothetical protein V5799_030857 [Amblyomma americanum]|uniref:Uncharacterized protein n=1 Tax=Amblyomma americanum TaxID=6943 RepID=A0AAQ4ELY5_AMBAM